MNRIAIFIPNFEIGGTEKFLVTLANNYFNAGKNVTLICCQDEGPLRNKLLEDIKLIKFNSFKLRRLIFEFGDHLKKNNYDAVIIPMYMIANVVIISKILYRFKTKIILRANTSFTYTISSEKNTFQKLALKNLSKFLYKFLFKVIAVSRGVKNDLLENTGLNKKNIEVIYNGVISKKLISYKIKKHSNLSKKFIFVGRLSPEKGILGILNSFIEMAKKDTTISLTILGDGPQEQEIIKIIKSNNLMNRINMMPFRDDYLSILSKHEVFVMNSEVEGLPSLLIEALALDLKIITSNCNYGPSEIVENHIDCCLFDLESKGLLESMQIMIKNHNNTIRDIDSMEDFFEDRCLEKYLNIGIKK